MAGIYPRPQIEKALVPARVPSPRAVFDMGLQGANAVCGWFAPTAAVPPQAIGAPWRTRDCTTVRTSADRWQHCLKRRPLRRNQSHQSQRICRRKLRHQNKEIIAVNHALPLWSETTQLSKAQSAQIELRPSGRHEVSERRFQPGVVIV